MPDSTKNEVVGIDLVLNPKDAIQASKRFQSALSKQMKVVEKNEKNLTGGLLKYLVVTNRIRKTVVPTLQKEVKIRQQLKGSITEQKQLLIKLNEETIRHQQALKEAKELGADVDMIKSLEEKIKLTKKNSEETDKLVKEQEKLLEVSTSKGMKAKNVLTDMSKSLPEAAKASGEWLVSPLQDFLSKDATALFKKASDASVFVLGTGAKKTGFLFGKFAAKALEKAKVREEAGKAGGGALKAVGALSGTVGQLFGFISKLGPIIQVASSFMMALVKTLVDAEAAAKDFNKQILSTAGTSEFLYRGMGNAAVAAQGLEASLNDLRNGAMDLSNIQWGISKDTAQSFLSALTAEGVSVGRLGDELKRTTGYAKDAASAIQMSVAYSRAFGVSLNEVTQLQGEMMAEMGMGLDSAQASFQEITRSAEEAGMASNKFFGIVRSFSADLTLFTLRMADVTKVLKVLGKVMSPREAQKFMQTISQKFTGGLAENVKHVTIRDQQQGAGATRKGAEKDLASRLEGLGEDISSAIGGGPVDDILDLIKKPDRNPRAIAKWAAKHPGKISGGLMESILKAAIMQSRLAKGTAIDTAAVLDQLSPLGKIEQLQAESVAFTGKRLEDLSNIDLMAMENAGIASAQEVRSYQLMQQGIISTQENMIARVQAGNATLEDIAVLDKLGIDRSKGIGEAQAAALREQFEGDKSNRKFWSVLSVDQQKLLEGSKDQIDFQKETAGFQTSSLDKLGIIADILMNYIYNAMAGIWDLMIKILPDWTAALVGFDKRFKSFEIEASKIRDPQIMGAVQESGGDIQKAKTKIIETSGKQMLADARAAAEEWVDVKYKLSQTHNAKEQAEFEKRLKLLEPFLAYTTETSGDLYKKKPEEVVEYLQILSEHLKKSGMRGAGVKAEEEEAARKAAEAAEAKRKAAVTGGAPAAATTPGAPAVAPKATTAPGAPAAVTAAPKAAEAAKEIIATQDGTKKAVEKVTDTLEKGITVGKPTSEYKRVVKNSTLEAIREGLFEYYLYSSIDPGTMAAYMKKGMDPMAMVRGASGGVAKTGSPAAYAAGLVPQTAPKAAGGIVSSIANGKANVSRLPPGEGWTSIGKGERIIPAGGRGGGGGVKVELELKGDLRRFVDARVVDGAANFERNKRLR